MPVPRRCGHFSFARTTRKGGRNGGWVQWHAAGEGPGRAGREPAAGRAGAGRRREDGAEAGPAGAPEGCGERGRQHR
nr:MAG TPA_asm: hypothetical protein [Bacteriophage sp.]